MLSRGFFTRTKKSATDSSSSATDDLAQLQMRGLLSQQTDSEAVLRDVVEFHSETITYSNDKFNDFAALGRLLASYRPLLGRINLQGVAICGGHSDRSVEILYVSKELGVNEAELEQLLSANEALQDDLSSEGERFALGADSLTAKFHRLDATADLIKPTIVFIGLSSGVDAQHAYVSMGHLAVETALLSGFQRWADSFEITQKLKATTAMAGISDSLLKKRNDVDFFLLAPVESSAEPSHAAKAVAPLVERFMLELKDGWRLDEVYVHILEGNHTVGVLVALGENAGLFGELLSIDPLDLFNGNSSTGLAVAETDPNSFLQRRTQASLKPQSGFATRTFDLDGYRNWGAVTYVWSAPRLGLDELFLSEYTGKLANLLDSHVATAELRRDSFVDRSTGYPNENAMLGALELMQEYGQTGCLVMLGLRESASYAENYLPEEIALLERGILAELRRHFSGRSRQFGAFKNFSGVISRSAMFFIMTGEKSAVGSYDCIGVVDELMDVISRPQTVGRHTIRPATSAGYVSLDEGFIPSEAVQECYVAQREASMVGPGIFREASHQNLVDRQERFEFEREIEAAIDRQQFEPFFQPEVSLVTGEVLSFEALVRWNHPRLGRVSPDVFIPIAEDKDLMVQVDLQMFEAAARQFVDSGFAEAGTVLRVNLSSTTLHHPGLALRVIDLCSKLGFRLSQLCIEVTETSVMREEDLALQCLHSFREAGIAVSLDDFGQGHSSLARLRELPITEIKVDRAFVGVLPGDAADRAFLRSVLSIAQAFGLETTAEGVETEAQRRSLIELGFSKGQGYLFGKPLPADEIPEMMPS